MTDLAELEPPIVIANRLRSRAAVYTEEGRHNAWGRLMLDAEATILSLIARVGRAEAELLEAQKDEASLLLIAHMDGADKGRKAGRAEALEEAAKVAEGFGPSRPLIAGRIPTERIRGRWEGEQASSGSIAAVIRALGEKTG